MSPSPQPRVRLSIPREDIERLVRVFYERAHANEILGPIFEAEVSDWDTHRSRVSDFWDAAINRTGEYSGRPIDAHRPLSLTTDHYLVWLTLFEQTAQDLLDDSQSHALVDLARAMARSIASRTGAGVLPDLD